MSRHFAYCRVSTAEQTTANQVLEISRSGFDVRSDRVVEESISGAVPAMQRPAFANLVENRMESGDTLIVTKLDRLGRNAGDVRATVDMLAARGVSVLCLAMGCVDLASSVGRLHMQILASIAEFERDMLIERTHAGLERAKQEGKVLGRRRTYTDEQAEQIRAVIANKECSYREAAARFGVSLPAVQRIVAEQK